MTSLTLRAKRSSLTMTQKLPRGKFASKSSAWETQRWENQSEFKIILTYVTFLQFYSIRLVDRFLIDGYKPQRLSTYALSLFRHRTTVNEEKVLIGKEILINFGLCKFCFRQQLIQTKRGKKEKERERQRERERKMRREVKSMDIFVKGNGYFSRL